MKEYEVHSTALIVTTIKAKSKEDAVDKLKSMDIKQVMKKSQIDSILLPEGGYNNYRGVDLDCIFEN